MATLPIHALFTAYVAEDTSLRSKQYIVAAVTTAWNRKNLREKIKFQTTSSYYYALAGDGVMISETAHLVSFFEALTLSFTFTKRWPDYVAGELLSMKICFWQHKKPLLLWIGLETTENCDNRRWRQRYSWLQYWCSRKNQREICAHEPWKFDVVSLYYLSIGTCSKHFSEDERRHRFCDFNKGVHSTQRCKIHQKSNIFWNKSDSNVKMFVNRQWGGCVELSDAHRNIYLTK